MVFNETKQQTCFLKITLGCRIKIWRLKLVRRSFRTLKTLERTKITIIGRKLSREDVNIWQIITADNHYCATGCFIYNFLFQVVDKHLKNISNFTC